jgi:ENTS family enterobactin (siderophore) exporter
MRWLGATYGLLACCEQFTVILATILCFAATGSTPLVGLTLAAFTGCDLVGITIGGQLADRCDRRRVARLAQLGAAGALGIAIAGAGISALWVVAFCLVARLGIATTKPSLDASLPNLVPAERLARANGTLIALRSAAITVVPVLTGLGADHLDHHVLLGAGVLVAVAGSLALLPLRGAFNAPAVAEPAAPRQRAGLSYALGGLRVLRHDRVLGAAFVAALGANLVFGLGATADLPYTHTVLHLGATGYGAFISSWGIGMIVGSQLAPRLLSRRSPETTYALGLGLIGVGILGVACTTSLLPAILARVAIGGIGSGVMWVALGVLFGTRVPDATRGRARSAFDGTAALAVSGSQFYGGMLTGAFGPRGAYAIEGIALAVVGTVLATSLRTVEPIAAARGQLAADAA